MNNNINVLIVIAVMVVIWGGSYLYKRRLADQISKAMASGDYETYKKLIFSKRALYFLNPSGIILMRATHCLAVGEIDEAEKHVSAIRVKRLQFDQKVSYVQTKSMLALNKKDEAMYDSVKELLNEMLAEGKQKDVIEALMQEHNQNKKLYFKFDSSVIEDLNKQIKAAKGSNKGLLYMTLAKAYHLNKQDKLSIDALNEAKELLKGSMYEQVIEETIKDLTIMD